MSTVKIDNENFESEVLENQGVVLIDFWASWCAPCRMLSPIVDEVAKELDNIRVGKINVDEEQELATRFDITSIPTLVVFKDGKEVKRSLGFISKDAVKGLLDM